MAPRIDFYFDFGSPNAYLAYKVIPEIEGRIGSAFDLKPALLGAIFKATGNQSPAVTLAGVPAKAAYEEQLTQRFVERHRLTQFRFNPAFPINTLQLMRGAILAGRLGLFAPYVDAVFSAMWEDALDLGRPEVWRDVLERRGLPAAEFAAGVADPEVKAGLIAATDEALARGVFGSPTFFVGSEMFFGKDQLLAVEEAILRRTEGRG